MNALTRFSYSRRALRWAGTAPDAQGAVERLAAGEELAVHGRNGGDAQGVALAAPYGRPLVERDPLGGLEFGGGEEVGDLARHVEGDQELHGRGVHRGGGVVAGEGGDRAAFQVGGADIAGLRGRLTTERPSATAGEESGPAAGGCGDSGPVPMRVRP
ncbi:hypothetical protein [Streptomyces cinerochromogenes]|uniref:hypothetical protein n=1 Tax=Streptomyces cinerochromogenes TaxID=66422 RepID=UPI00167085D2|nr:hypothetical protein [Streptomyces cinerochromogenes]